MNPKSSHKENLDAAEHSLFRITSLLNESNSFQKLSELLPGAFHINSLDDFSIQFFNKAGEEVYKSPIEIVKEKGLTLMRKVIHPDEFLSVPPRLSNFVALDDYSSTLSFFQRLKGVNEKHYEWYFTSCKLTEYGILSISHPVKSLGSHKVQIERVLDENIYFKKNFKKFMSLTKREKQLLKELAIGKTAPQISNEYFIAVNTVKTHRQRIFEKLEVKTVTELYKYAFHFDLLSDGISL